MAKQKASAKKYREDNKEKIAATKKIYYELHKEQLCAEQKTYREDNKEEIAAQKKIHYEEHKEEIAAKAKIYREAHTDQVASYSANYRADHREEINAKKREKNKPYRVFFETYVAVHEDDIKARRKIGEFDLHQEVWNEFERQGKPWDGTLYIL